ncbi:MAG: alkaline phosphatase D family protein, partial [Acidovorax sp.]
MSPAQRRSFLRYAAWAAAAHTLPRWAWSNPPSLATNPFALGVASGDPATDSVVLWTRLVLADPAHMQGSHTVRWELAHDARFAQIVHQGETTAHAGLGHSVHVEVAGLAPDRWYHYRFMLGDATSTTGRTRTAPAANVLAQKLRLAFASCQRWEHGHYAAWRNLVADHPDLVLFLGDYIYEYATPRNTAGLARTHSLRHASTLADYRDRYALHK